MQYYRIDTPQLPISLFGTALLATLARRSAPLPQKWPIYYVNTDSLGHTENRENKTAGRQLVDFRKAGYG